MAFHLNIDLSLLSHKTGLPQEVLQPEPQKQIQGLSETDQVHVSRGGES